MGKRVTEIPATLNRFNSTPIVRNKKKRVCGYARVSTDSEEQATSYDAQLDYYTNYIKAHKDWEFVGMYADEGISGTSTKHRKGFNDMIRDAIDGKIDLIITKSVSRFARNTVDSLQTVRKLKEKGVEIYFEKENIWTLDSKGELLITIMSSLAQEESRSISENVAWGKRKAMADGKVSVSYSTFLGYDKGPNGEFVINEEQAKVVRMIFKWYLMGQAPAAIAKRLTEMKIPTPAGKEKWWISTVQHILVNEKYKGDALLQKTYTEDFLTKKQKKNSGELKQYYVEKHHEPIISVDEFNRVQEEIEKRRNYKQRYSSNNIFSGKLICGDCGEMFGRMVTHANSKYEKVGQRCIRKYKDGHKCFTPFVTDEKLKEWVVQGINKYLTDKEEIIKNLEEIRTIACDTEELEKQRDDLEIDMNIIYEHIQRLISQAGIIDAVEYEKKYNKLTKEYERAKSKREEILINIKQCEYKNSRLQGIIDIVEKTQEIISEFDEVLWFELVDKMIIYSKVRAVIIFRDGTEIEVE